MIKIRIIENSSCLSCGAVSPLMVRIGAFVMCKKCTKAEFGTKPNGELKSDVENMNAYGIWLKKYKESV